MQKTKQQPKQLELLKQLVGEWAIGIVLKTHEGKIASGCGTMAATETASGFGVASEMEIRIEGYDDYLEHDLWSFDRWTNKVHLFSVTSSGAVHDHVGEWNDDETLELKWSGIYENKQTTEDITVKWLSKDEIRVKEADCSEDKTTLTADYVFKRK